MRTINNLCAIIAQRPDAVAFVNGSEKYKEINDLIITRFDLGTTIYQANGGFTGNEAHAVLTVINKRELFAIQEAVMKLDPAAFIIISQVNEVKGRGFTLQKKYPEDTSPSRK